MSESENEYRIGQRVLVRSRAHGMREAIIRNFHWDEDDERPLVVVDLDPPARGGGSMGIRVMYHQIVGPVVRK